MARGAIAMLGLVAGCSFTAMKSPPARVTPGVPPDCSSSRAAPVVDVVGAGFGAIYTIVFTLAAGLRSDSDDGDTFAAAALGSAVVTGVFTASAVSGFRKAGRCRAAEAAFALTFGSYGPQPYPPQPYPAQPYPPQPYPAQPYPPQAPPVAPEPAPGATQARCRLPPESPCDPGLTCISGFCVPPPPIGP